MKLKNLYIRNPHQLGRQMIEIVFWFERAERNVQICQIFEIWDAPEIIANKLEQISAKIRANLMNPSHKATNPESRKNHALIWSRRCEYHGGRPGVVLHDGVWLCEECAPVAAICAEI